MKILVIEDEPGLREAVVEVLRRESYLADGVDSGELGLDMIKTGLYDLVILDIMLPGISGLDVLTIVRKLHIDIPIILLTALSQLDNKIAGMDSGADDYLTKPFETKELLARIRMIMRRSNAVSNSIASELKLGNLILNTSNFCISSSDKKTPVQLAKKEFHILEYLMHNAGSILSREQITTKVWGFDAEAEYNNVDVYISYIRKKLKYLSARVQIVAVRGMGYKIIEVDDD